MGDGKKLAQPNVSSRADPFAVSPFFRPKLLRARLKANIWTYFSIPRVADVLQEMRGMKNGQASLCV